MTLLNSGKTLIEFCQVSIALGLGKLVIQIRSFLLRKVVRAVSSNVEAFRFVACGVLNFHTHLHRCNV